MAVSTETAKAFINTIGPIIQQYAKSMGYHVCSPIIAQACCEGAYGTSKLASPPYNNHFGMKVSQAWVNAGRPSVNMSTGEEYTTGVYSTIKANFRCYSDMTECVAGYFSFISASRYAALKSCKTPEEYLKAIKAAGYATSSTYVATNLAIVDKWNLRSWDWESTETKVEDEYEPLGEYVNGSTTETVYADTACTKEIGSLNRRETCHYMGTIDSCAMVLYEVGSTGKHKVGFVKWLGGIK